MFKILETFKLGMFLGDNMIQKKIKKIKRLFILIQNSFRRDPDRFLKEVSGLLHVGANVGQESKAYDAYNLNVIWVEPIPQVFTQLQTNIASFTKQRAFQALLTDVDGQEYEFKIANNNGASSSIFDFKQHSDIWPSVKYLDTILLQSMTLPTFFKTYQLEVGDYQALVLDTQGSELLVLKGSLPILKNFKFIKTEVPDFESYQGCCQLSDIESFMKKNGYKEFSKRKFASKRDVGNYFDVVYKKQD